MKKIILFAAVAGMGLAAAAPPGGSPWPRTAQGGYPPCSKTVKDRCIQLYERGVATKANLALNERLGRDGTRMAAAPPPAPVIRTVPTPPRRSVGGPYEPLPYDRSAITGWPAGTRGEAYPPCTRLITDRCIQMYEGGRKAR